MWETVTITAKEYAELTRAYVELSALHRGGVDSWDWYYESLKDAGLIDEED